MAADHLKPRPPKKNEYLDDPEQDVTDLLFDKKEKKLSLGKQKRVTMIEYLGGGKPITQKKCNEFLGRVMDGMSMTRAAQKVGTSLATIWRLRKNNEVFDLALTEALEVRNQALIEKSIDQATEGVISGGKITFPSNPQLVMHVKAADPDKYRDRSEVISRQGEDVKPIRQPGDREKLLELIEKFGKKPDEDDDNVEDLL